MQKLFQIINYIIIYIFKFIITTLLIYALHNQISIIQYYHIILILNQYSYSISSHIHY
jgi:hypothetical protein